MQDASNKELGYFVDKFRRRLYRSLAQFMTVEEHVAKALEARSGEISTLLGMTPRQAGEVELKDHARKTSLIALKAEWELFLSMACRKSLSHAFVQATLKDDLASLERFFPGGSQALELWNAATFSYETARMIETRRLFVKLTAPEDGLEDQRRVLGLCGVELAPDDDVIARLATRVGELDVPERVEPWAQIATALQVRHSIEHTFSKIAPHDVDKFEATIRESSWARHFPDGPIAERRLLVDRVDVLVTAAAMSVLAQYLSDEARRLGWWR